MQSRQLRDIELRRRPYRRSLLPRFPRLIPRFPSLLPRFSRRAERGPIVAVMFLAILGFAFVSANQSGSPTLPAAEQAAAGSKSARFSMCGSNRYTCVVDGDTIWLEGQNLRLQSFDTPEPYNDICGGAAEVALAKRASARLLQLLNSNSFTVETGGADRYGRVLATVRVAGRDVGDILIEEGLARRWPNGHEWWC